MSNSANAILTVVITGSEGMVGRAVSAAFVAAGWRVLALTAAEGDITNTAQWQQRLRNVLPYAVVNCAALTNVDACETSEYYQQAVIVNGTAVVQLARLCQDAGVHFVHLSSDYVARGTRLEGMIESYLPTQPMNAYGETKLLAENGLRQLNGGIDDAGVYIHQNPRMYCIRTQWVFGLGGKNFVNTIMQLAKTRTHISVVEDEIGCCMSADILAGRIVDLLAALPSAGVYHMASSTSCSRYELAVAIVQQLGSTCVVQPTTMAQYNRAAFIAPVSVLKNTKLPTFPPWEEMLQQYLLSIS